MRHALTLTALAACAAAGCQFLDRKPAAPANPPPLKVAASRVIVQPWEVSAANAHTKAQQLNDEMDRDMDGESIP